jgi:acyl carrier protein
MLQTLKEILAKSNKKLDVENINGETRIYEEIDIDSLELAEFIILIEEEFDISIGDDEVDECQNMNDLVSLVEQRLFDVR